MEWNVFYYNMSLRRIDKFNIFNHGRFHTEVEMIFHDHKDDFDEFSRQVRAALNYFFGHKAEWEITTLSDEKIDIFDQVIANWDVFIRGIWEELGGFDGYWIVDEDEDMDQVAMRCSFCNKMGPTATKFCPNCGRRMKGIKV